ncbi:MULTISPECIES: hypothetical protein [Aphanothece]|uniref:hypothetical protein n=1 Tax=Aphanothece TaxID=1121 RepID=UPI0039854C3C
MAQSRPAQSPRPLRRSRWRGPLVAGFCFGLGYGVTQRLLALQLPALVQLRQGFEVREFPGTSLESLRLRFGSDSKEIRGDLELMELEQQAKQREAKRKEEQRQQELDEQRRQTQLQAEEARSAEPAEPVQQAPLEPALPDPGPEPEGAPQAPALPSPGEP